jgi:hypothetical protein
LPADLEERMRDRVMLSYRQHRIVAAYPKNTAIAVVSEGSAKLFQADAPTRDEAVGKAKAWVDNRVDGERARRRDPHIGTAEEYRRAFRAVEVGDHHAAMLRAHANAPNQTLTATELARSAGYDSFSAANLHYGVLGYRIAGFLELPVPESPERKQPVWTSALADGPDDAVPDGQWRWVMHPEVLKALRDLGMA